MLMVQGSLFHNSKSGFKHLGGGCFSEVYSVPDSDNVVKVCHTAEDGALAWLMYCMTQQGRKGVPVIESLVLTEYDGIESHYCERHLGGLFTYDVPVKRVGYVATMKRYLDSHSAESDPTVQEGKPRMRGVWNDGEYVDCCTTDYLEELRADYEMVTGREWNDLHSGNVMYCKDTKSWVVTDPDSMDFSKGEREALAEALKGVVRAFDLLPAYYDNVPNIADMASMTETMKSLQALMAKYPTPMPELCLPAAVKWEGGY